MFFLFVLLVLGTLFFLVRRGYLGTAAMGGAPLTRK